MDPAVITWHWQCRELEGYDGTMKMIYKHRVFIQNYIISTIILYIDYMKMPFRGELVIEGQPMIIM